MQLKIKGFSLVELMVALVAGLLLVGAASALFASIIKANRTSLQISRLNQELQSITDMIGRDIQRAGYDASAANHTLVSGASLFYFDSTSDLMNETATGSGLYRCIRLRYDDDEDGDLDSGSETRVYRYNDTNKEIGLGDGSSPACGTGTWHRVSSEDEIAITNLTFALLPSSVSAGARTVRVSITGNDKRQSALSLTLQRDIKLRNDGY